MFEEKYLKYKKKYLNLKKINIAGGGFDINKQKIIDEINDEKNDAYEIFKKVDVSLRNDKEVVLAAIEKSEGLALEFTSEELKNDIDVVKFAIQQDVEGGGGMFKYASEDLKNNFDLVMFAIQHSQNLDIQEHPLRFVSEKFKNNPEIVLASCEANHQVIPFASETIKKIIKIYRKYNGINI